MSKNCIVWDFDNTLAKRDGMWTKSLCNVLENNGIYNYDSSVISKSFNSGFPWHRHDESHSDYMEENGWWEYVNSILRNALKSLNILNESEIFEIVGQFKDEYLRIDAWELYDDTIQNLKQSINLGYDNIVLSNHTPELEDLVNSMDISKYFRGIITSAIVGYEKPNKKIFEFLMENYKYDKYYMVGDSYQADIIGANNVGFTSILVRNININDYSNYSHDLQGIWKYIDEKIKNS